MIRPPELSPPDAAFGTQTAPSRCVGCTPTAKRPRTGNRSTTNSRSREHIVGRRCHV